MVGVLWCGLVLSGGLELIGKFGLWLICSGVGWVFVGMLKRLSILAGCG